VVFFFGRGSEWGGVLVRVCLGSNGRWMTDVPAAAASGCAASLALAIGLFCFFFGRWLFWRMALLIIGLFWRMVFFIVEHFKFGVGMETSIVDSLILWAEVPGR
jgi:hypothetical protein